MEAGDNGEVLELNTDVWERDNSIIETDGEVMKFDRHGRFALHHGARHNPAIAGVEVPPGPFLKHLPSADPFDGESPSPMEQYERAIKLVPEQGSMWVSKVDWDPHVKPVQPPAWAR